LIAVPDDSYCGPLQLAVFQDKLRRRPVCCLSGDRHRDGVTLI
jgi:hypothetical protein